MDREWGNFHTVATAAGQMVFQDSLHNTYSFLFSRSRVSFHGQVRVIYAGLHFPLPPTVAATAAAVPAAAAAVDGGKCTFVFHGQSQPLLEKTCCKLVTVVTVAGSIAHNCICEVCPRT